MTATLYVPYASCTIGGNFVQCSGARVESSFSDPVSKGYVKFYTDPGGWSQGDEVVIALGSGANNVDCFRGTILEGDWLNSGPNFELVCRGPLLSAQKFRNNRPKGYTLWDLTGGPATDEAIARAVLDIAGVDYDSGNIGGTGITRGSSAPDGYTWRKGESALEYLSRLGKASIGYRMVETIGGTVFRTQVLAGNATAEATFTEGIDIFDGGHTQIETFDTYDAWEVTGFDYGDGLHAVYNRYPDPIPNGSSAYAYSSEMIERGPDSDSRGGISCETVLGYLRGEQSSAITKLSGLQTPRDDLLGPGGGVQIDSDMLGVHQTFYIVSVVRETTPDWFIQTLELSG